MPIQNGAKKIFLWGIPIVVLLLIISTLLFLHFENKKKIAEAEQEVAEAKQLGNYYGTLSSIYEHICWSEKFSLECATVISNVWENGINEGLELGGVAGAGVLSELGVRTVLDELEKQGHGTRGEGCGTRPGRDADHAGSGPEYGLADEETQRVRCVADRYPGRIFLFPLIYSTHS